MANPYTYADLKDDVKSSIWPNGPPENLVIAIDRMILQSVNWLQQNIECFKDEHLDVIPQCATYFHCGLTVIDKPDGVINKIFTVQNDGFCDPVTYDEVSKSELLNWSRWLMKLVTTPSDAALTVLAGGFAVAGVATDDTSGRALFGKWSKDGNRILVSPWLQSYESVVVDWKGYKTTWNNTDVVPDAPDYKRAVKLFVQREFARDFERDAAFQQICGDDLQGNPGRGIIGAIPSLIFQCREKMRQRQSQHSPTETDYLWLNYKQPVVDEDPPQAEIIIAAIGDYGSAGTPELEVADLVKSWNPSHIITLGDNNYPSGAAATIDANVGQYYHDFISPYKGAYGADKGTNRFWPALGNHDLDLTVSSPGQPYKDYFALPNNERYYDVVIGPVHFFIINSGYNTAGVLKEADGITATSIQANYILMRAVKSTIKWKIAVLHHPPYTSRPANGSFGYYPGTTALRWPFKKYGFDAVLSGHGHGYERIIVDDFPYFVNGSGGNDLVAFSGPSVTGSAKQYSADYGALKISASCDSLTIAFKNTDDVEIDSYTIT